MGTTGQGSQGQTTMLDFDLDGETPVKVKK